MPKVAMRFFAHHKDCQSRRGLDLHSEMKAGFNSQPASRGCCLYGRLRKTGRRHG